MELNEAPRSWNSSPVVIVTRASSLPLATACVARLQREDRRDEPAAEEETDPDHDEERERDGDTQLPLERRRVRVRLARRLFDDDGPAECGNARRHGQLLVRGQPVANSVQAGRSQLING